MLPSLHQQVTDGHTKSVWLKLKSITSVSVGDFPVVSTVVVVWRSCNVVGQINEVTLRQAQLVPGWVTVYGRVNHLGM